MACQIPKTMRAAQVVAHREPLKIHEVPVPQPKYGEVLIKLEVTGVCHTDLHVLEGDWEVKCPLPMTPGHEGVGEVVGLGEGVTNLKIGDRVCIPWLHKSCGACAYCWGGWETVCENQERTGFTAHGSFAEYCVAHSEFVGRVPAKLSSEQAAPITCAGITVYKGLKVSEVKPGQYVSIVGAAGGLGHVAIQYAKAMGMKVIGIDSGPEKAKFMKELGCEHTVDVTATKDVVAEVKKITGKGAHGALVLSPSPDALGQAVHYMRPLGVVVAIALPPGNFQTDYFSVVLNAITIRGSIVGTRLDLEEALEMAADGKVKCIVSAHPFEKVNDVLCNLRDGKINGRAVLKFEKK